MKRIEELSNVEKARILHELFPDEIPQFLDYALGVAEFVQQEIKSITEKWDNELLPPELWLDLAIHAQGSINQFNVILSQNSHAFSMQLADGFNAEFITYCLKLYTTTQRLGNQKFSLAVDLLFNP